MKLRNCRDCRIFSIAPTSPSSPTASPTSRSPQPPALPTFQFEVITVDGTGRETNRRPGQAEYFTEDLGNLIKWYVLILNRLPRDHKFILGDRIIGGRIDFENLLLAARKAQKGKLNAPPQD